MAYRDDWTRYIRQRAAKYGLDPQAVLAVASREGLSGAVGDQGTSFGPFQLHVGGALPRGRGRGWAESNAGIDYALGQMGGVARGLRGRAAIENIVRRFERPANPGGEIAGALAALPSFGAGAGPALAPAGPSPGPGPAVGGAAGAQPNFADLIRTRLFSSMRSGDAPDWMSLASLARKGQAAPAAPRVGPGPSAAPVNDKQTGNWVDPATGKVIGTPYSGTHTLGNWESDRALDVALPIGTPVRSPFGGVVGSQFGSLGSSGRFQGLRLHVASPKNEWYGAHLSRYAPGIKPGVRVRPGQVVGYSGSASGVAHLHEALRSGNPYSLIR